jgi:hypothetical protein
MDFSQMNKRTRRLPGDGELWRDADHDNRSADAKLAEVLQLRDSHTFVGKECAVRGFQIAQANDVVLDLDRAVPARDFLIIDHDVRVRTSNDDTRLLHGIDHAASRARDHRKGDGLSCREAQAGFFIASPARKPGRARASSKFRQRRQHLGRIGTLRNFDDRVFPALRAAKLHARMTHQLRGGQRVLGATT